jgi:hypothetical protein
MLSRVAFALITLFWVTMNFLLWRSEFGGPNHLGPVVPVERVWQQMLTAPDNSSLEILHHGQKIGFCRWAASVGDEPAQEKASGDEVPPEGMVKRLSSYRINFDGNVAVADFKTRLRFDLELKLAANHAWNEFNLRLNLRPDAWEIHSAAAEQTIRLKTMDEQGRSERVFKFSDLQNPDALLRELGAPPGLGLLTGLGGLPGSKAVPPLALGLRWEARNDSVTIGHASVRAYRLQAGLLDRYRITIFVSRVGEILRVELPDEIVLVNDQLSVL